MALLIVGYLLPPVISAIAGYYYGGYTKEQDIYKERYEKVIAELKKNCEGEISATSVSAHADILASIRNNNVKLNHVEMEKKTVITDGRKLAIMLSERKEKLRKIANTSNTSSISENQTQRHNDSY